jgi:hypothetical protein
MMDGSVNDIWPFCDAETWLTFVTSRRVPTGGGLNDNYF